MNQIAVTMAPADFSPSTRILAPLAGALLLMTVLWVPVSATYGSFGTVPAAADADVFIWGDLGATFATAVLAFEDADNDCVLDANEAVVLDVDGDGTIDFNDILLTKRGSTAAGTQVTTTAQGLGVTGLRTTTGGTPSGCAGGTALSALLLFKDLLPGYEFGGPDGNFGPGETLYIDVNGNGAIDVDDVRLTKAGAQAAGNRVTSSTSEFGTTAVWDPNTECVYISSASSVDGTAVRISTCAGGTLAEASTAACGADADCGDVLRTLSNVKITGADTTFDAGEDAYITSATTVGNGAFRITATAGGARGTAVVCNQPAPDADCGTALKAITNTKVSTKSVAFAFPGTKPFIAWDKDGTGSYSTGDVVYFNINGDDYPTPGDARLSAHGTLAFGTVVAVGDADTALPLTLTFAGPLILYNDLDSDGLVDNNEQIVLDLNANTAFDVGEVRLDKIGTCQAGTLKKASDSCDMIGTWKDVTTATNAGSLRYWDSDNNGRFNVGDILYVHFGVATSATAGDVRLTTSGTLKAGDRVISSSADTGRTTVALDAAPVPNFFGAVDVDNSGGYTAQDVVILDILGDGFITLGDVFLSPVGTMAYGSIADAGKLGTVHQLLAVPGALELVYVDLDGSSTLSLQDSVYLRLASATAAPLAVGDLRLSPGPSSRPAGKLLTAGDSGEVGRTVILLAGATISFYDANADGSLAPTENVYVDADASGRVSVGDVRLSTVGSLTKGSKVQTQQADEGRTLVAAPGVVRAFDRDQSGGFSVGDEVYLNHDNAAEAAIGTGAVVSLGDFRLTGTGGATSIGGGTQTTTQTTQTTTRTTTTVTTTHTTTTGTTGTTTSPPDDGTAALVAAANGKLQETITVERTDQGNLIRWEPQGGADGYQLWRSTSPWMLLATLVPTQSAYTDHGAPADAKYIVTSFYKDSQGRTIGKFSDLEAQAVPGVPELTGKAPATQTTTTTPTTMTETTKPPTNKEPFLAPAFLIATLVVALLLVRRRRP
jgi:hypothetical protein